MSNSKKGKEVELNLTEAERKIILNDLIYLEPDLDAIVRQTPPGQPIKMTLDDLDNFGEYLAAEACQTKDRKLEKKLDQINDKITALLDKYTDKPPKTVKIEDAKKTKLIEDQADRIADRTAKVLAVAGQMNVKSKVVETFVPGKLERVVLSSLPTVTAKVRNKMSKGEMTFTAVEVCSMATAVAKELPGANVQQQVGLMMVAKTLTDSLQKWICETGEAKFGKTKSKPSIVYQFKITLVDSEPPIWRRIQIENGTLDDLHEHIQTAMGWTNSHLHQFEIEDKLYGDPDLLEDMDGVEFEDSTSIWLSEILPAGGKRFRFSYEYDFGDSWRHEVLFEGSPAPKKGKKYPLCLEGERACPPEDCGGMGGYVSFLEAIADPKHEEHESMLEWVGGKFDPVKFSAVKATKEMREGLPDWRNEDDGF